MFAWIEELQMAENSDVYVVRVTYGIVLVYLVWMIWACSRYIVYFDGQSIIVGYIGWKVTLAINEIESAEKVDIAWLKWGGMGWRIRGLKSIGYITKSGPGIEIQTTRKGRKYTFNCADQHALLSEMKRFQIQVKEKKS